MGDLSFGESFNCLHDGYHPWVRLIFDLIEFSPWGRFIAYYPFMAPFGKILLPRNLQKRVEKLSTLAIAKAEHRKSQIGGRLDLAAGLLLPGSGITEAEYRDTVRSFIIAGSETTATVLSGATFHLLKNPDKHKKLVSEIRNAFKSADEITFLSVGRLEYLVACLTEALRVYPPISDYFPRKTGNVPELICGKMVPPEVFLSHRSTEKR